MLDRRTGTPIAKVEERAVPKGGVADDWTAPMQPYSVGMPSIGTEPLSEQRMWGLTPLDQLICRIDFRRSRYEGEFTPPSERLTLQYPSWLGGMNWGSVTIAENLGYLVVNDTRVATRSRMILRQAYDEGMRIPQQRKRAITWWRLRCPSPNNAIDTFTTRTAAWNSNAQAPSHQSKARTNRSPVLFA